MGFCFCFNFLISHVVDSFSQLFSRRDICGINRKISGINLINGLVLRLKWSDFQNDRLYCTMGKNLKASSLTVPKEALAILEQYRRENPKHDLAFQDLESLPDLDNALNVQRRIKTRVRKNNEQLQKVLEEAKITKTVTMHISRHTFSNITGDKYSPQMLQNFKGILLLRQQWVIMQTL